MKLRPDEIANILKTEIERYEGTADVEEVGTVIQIGDGIARIYGLDRCVALEKLDFDHGVTGLALNLEEDNVAAVLFGPWEQIREGDTVRRTGEVMSIPVGEAMVGRVVNPLGIAIDGGPAVETTETRPSRPLPTGTSTIVPVRRTVSPSRISASEPKMTMPTLSASRLSAMPLMPLANSTISPAWTLSSP